MCVQKHIQLWQFFWSQFTNFIINLILPDTLCKYTYQKILGKQYLIIEWKSGDYVFGKFINGYYVLEKND